MKRLVNFLKDILTFVAIVLFLVLEIIVGPISYVIKKIKKKQKKKLQYVEFYDTAKVVKKKYVPAYTKYEFLLGKQFYQAQYYVIFNYKGWKCTIKGKKAFESLVEQTMVMVRGYKIYNEKGEIFQVHIQEII